MSPLIGGSPEEVEARAESARRKYGAQTINEILSRIIILTLVGYIVIAFCVAMLFLSPIDERLLTSILLVFVLVEMLTEYALWAFTYQGMRKTEAPLQDLQKFSTLTKEGWKRAELIMDITTPIFKGLEQLKNSWFPDWREKKDEKEKELPPEVVKSLDDIARVVGELSHRLSKLEKDK